MDITARLEQEHRNYKLKKLIFNYIAPLFIVGSIGIVVFIYNTSETPTTQKEVKKEVVKQKVAPAEKHTTKEVKEIEKTSTLNPSFSFEKSFQKTKEKVEVEENKIKEESLPSMFTKKSISPIDRLQENYKNNPNFITALEIGKLYYEKGEYQGAFNWSIKANEIDSTKEDSWVIFTKSSIKLGKTDIALKAIDSYLRVRHSDKLQRIKEEIFQ